MSFSSGLDAERSGISLTNPYKEGRVVLLLRFGCGDTPRRLVGGISFRSGVNKEHSM